LPADAAAYFLAKPNYVEAKFSPDFCDFPSCFSLQRRGRGSLQELTAANTLNLYQVSGEAGKIFT
jgi:hypothetical protein